MSRLALPLLLSALLVQGACSGKGSSSLADGAADAGSDAARPLDASATGGTGAGTGGITAPTASGGSGGGMEGGGSGGAPAGTGGDGSGGAGSGGRSGSSSGGATGEGGRGGTGGMPGGAATGGTSSGGAGGQAAGQGGDGQAGGPGTGAGGAAGCGGLVCEDFESGNIDATKWDTVASGGTLAVETQQVAHGKYAARVHGLASGSDDWALLVAKNVPAALRGTTTFGRAYVYFPPEVTSSIHVQFAFAGKNGTGGGNGPAPFSKLRYLEIASYSGVWQQGFDLLDVSPTVEEVSYSKNHLPTNKWVCVEWQLNDAPDTVTVWLDGAQVATFDNTNVSYASPGPVPKSGAPLYDGTSSGLVGGFDTFGFGFHDWHPQKAFDLYYDDVVLDTKRPGCLN